jgi:hypothetical protein
MQETHAPVSETITEQQAMKNIGLCGESLRSGTWNGSSISSVSTCACRPRTIAGVSEQGLHLCVPGFVADMTAVIIETETEVWLGTGNPVHPENNKHPLRGAVAPRQHPRRRLIRIWRAVGIVGHHRHCSSRLRSGRRSGSKVGSWTWIAYAV